MCHFRYILRYTDWRDSFVTGLTSICQHRAQRQRYIYKERDRQVIYIGRPADRDGWMTEEVESSREHHVSAGRKEAKDEK